MEVIGRGGWRRGTAAIWCCLVLLAGIWPASAQGHPVVPDHWRAGVNLTDWTPDGYAHARGALEAARADGITSVSLVPTLYVDDASDSSVAPEPSRTPTDASLERAAEEAHALGMQVTIKPHVDALDGTFRGQLQPADAQEWFASYGHWLAHYARLAERVHADTLVIGTELDSLTGDDAAFRNLIAAARTDFHGRLTYAANWNAVAAVGFWDELDLIGVDAYMPLAQPGAAEGDLQAAWAPMRSQLEQLHARTGKPVAFTELGYQSRAGALVSPFDAAGPADEGVQARAYDAAFAAWAGVSWFQGISWWDWSADPAEAPADADVGFSPRGKQAELVMRRWLTGSEAIVVRRAASSASTVTGLALATLAALVIIAVVRMRRRRLADKQRSQIPAGHPATALLDRARTTLDSDTIVLFVRDPSDPRVAHVAMGLGVPDELVGGRISSDEGLVGHVLITGNPIGVADYTQLPEPIQHPAAPGVVAALSVPLRLDGVVIGALSVGRAQQYAPSERHLLTPLADALAETLRAELDRRPASGTPVAGQPRALSRRA